MLGILSTFLVSAGLAVGLFFIVRYLLKHPSECSGCSGCSGCASCESCAGCAKGKDYSEE